MRDWPCDGFNARDLWVLVQCAAQDSPLVRAVSPEHATSADLLFLRSIEYQLRWQSWTRTREGERGLDRPEPIRFTWEAGEDVGYAADPLTDGEAIAFLGWEDAIREENEKRAAAGLPLVPTH